MKATAVILGTSFVAYLVHRWWNRTSAIPGRKIVDEKYEAAVDWAAAKFSVLFPAEKFSPSPATKMLVLRTVQTDVNYALRATKLISYIRAKTLKVTDAQQTVLAVLLANPFKPQDVIKIHDLLLSTYKLRGGQTPQLDELQKLFEL